MAQSRSKILVLVSTQRSGSNWVEDRLASHPDVTFAPHEPFRRSLRTQGSFERFRSRGLRSLYRGPLAPVGRWRFLGALRNEANTPVLGLRVMYDQLQRAPTLGPTLLATRPLVVHLVRRNVLATHVSAVRARRTGRFISSASTTAAERITLDAESLVASLDRRTSRIELHRRLLAHLSVPVIEVAYEDYVRSPHEWDSSMLRFLGLSGGVPLQSDLQRTSLGALADGLDNTEEVAHALRGTRYSSLLDQP